MSEMYTCPMHPEVRQDGPGKCPKCGMALVKESELELKKEGDDKEYGKLFTLIGMIALAAAATGLRDFAAESFAWQEMMMNFMAGAFLVFGGVKMLDLKGFVEGYSTYDLLAMKIPAYGYVYAMMEVGLGLAYLTRFQLDIVNWVTLVLMLFSSLGVIRSMMKKQKIMCACLGTFLKLPLSSVTLVEDLSMAVMAAAMLFFAF